MCVINSKIGIFFFFLVYIILHVRDIVVTESHNLFNQ